MSASSRSRLCLGAIGLSIAILALLSLERRTSARTQLVKSTKPTSIVHERFATFLAGRDFKAAFVLENFRQDVPVIVTPGLILDEGEVFLDPVSVGAHSTTTIDISAFLLAHGYKDARGTAVMRYNFSPYDPITGVVLSSDEVHDLYLNSYAQSPEEYWQGTSYDAVLWAPDEETRGFISLTNTSHEPRVVHATFLVKGHSELKTLEIPARHTQTLYIDDLVARSHESGAGIHLDYSEYPGDVVVDGHLYNERTGFEKYIHFLDKTLKYPTGSVRTQFLLLGTQPTEDGFPGDVSFRSVAVVRNIDSAPVQVTPIVKFSQGNSAHAISLRTLILGVSESRVIDFTEEQNAGLLPRELHQASLELDPHTDHASIVAELSNFSDRTGGYAVGPFFFSYPTRATGSLWRIDGDFQTTLMIENTAPLDDEVTLKLFSERDAYNKTFPVPAGGLLKINVKQLQKDHVPDKDGHILLAASGLLSLSGKNGHLSKLSFDKLIHNGENSDYVGLPGGGGGGGGGCYTESVALYLDFSAYPFAVMTEYSWSDGSSQDAHSQGTASGNTALLQISSNGSWDVATMTPTDSQPHLVSFTGPPTSVTDCPACSADNETPTGSATVPGNPAQLLVIGDTTTFPTNCPNTKLRILAYQIQDASGNDIKMNESTKEAFGSKSSNTCNTSVVTSESCSDTPSGIIHDTITVGCNTVDNGCGYTYTRQQWILCHGPASFPIGTVGDLVVHDNAISVGGSFTSIKGRVITP